MRVLVVPEVYRPSDATASGTLRDAIAWVEYWLERDPRVHVYWLLPPRSQADYARGDVLADRERVTLLEAEGVDAVSADGTPTDDTPTDAGYTPAQLDVIRDEIFDAGAYLDAVVDQLRNGRPLLSEWLLAHVDHWATTVRPFDVIANVHDLQVPFKYRYCSHRNHYQLWMECAAVAFTDGRWFTADCDRRRFREWAPTVLRPDVVAHADAASRSIGSPLDVDSFDETYADEPRTFHVAGSLWAKKHVEEVLSIGETLAERYGIETVLTSMESIPEDVHSPDWLTAYPNADRETYEGALSAGDLTVCASEYETMPRTPFEQAASGQVLVLRDEPWVAECVPTNHPLVVDFEDLGERATWAVEHWQTAVDANRRLVEYTRRTRRPAAVGERTYEDLRARIDRKRRAFDPSDRTRRLVEQVVDGVDGGVSLDAVDAQAAKYTADGRPLTADADCAYIDIVYALRSLGYADTGAPGTPRFEPVRAEPRSAAAKRT